MAALSQLRTDLQYRYRDTAGKFLSSVPANLFLNIAFEDFTNDVEPVWREYGFYVTGKQYVYNLPSDFLHSLTMMWYQNGQYEIPYLSPQEFKQRGFMNRRITVSTPQAYTIDFGQNNQRQLILGPAPGSSSNLGQVTGVGSIAPTDTSLTTFSSPSVNATQFQSPAGLIQIDSEQIAYQSNDGATVLGLLLRGQGGTTAATHGSCSTIKRLDLVMMYAYAFKYMVADSDVPSFEAQYQRIPIHYALSLALRADGRDKQSEQEMEIYEKLKLTAKREVRLLTRDRHNRKISSAYN